MRRRRLSRQDSPYLLDASGPEIVAFDLLGRGDRPISCSRPIIPHLLPPRPVSLLDPRCPLALSGRGYLAKSPGLRLLRPKVLDRPQPATPRSWPARPRCLRRRGSSAGLPWSAALTVGLPRPWS